MENISISLIAIVVLLVANGFFVAAEFALVKAKGFRIETLANEGNAKASLTLRIQQNLEAYLAACQLGITMASLGLGWVGEPAVAALLEPWFHSMGMPEEMLHTTAFIIGFLIFSSLHIVVGEQVPKTLAIRKPEPVSLWCAYPLHVSYLIVYPLNWVLNSTTRSILKLFKVAEATHADIYTTDEIKGLVATSEEHGEMGMGKALMLKNLLEFDQKNAGRIMIPKTSVNLLDINASAEENLAIIRKSGHSRFPLIDSLKQDEIVGMVLTKDVYAGILDEDPTPWANLDKYCRQPMVIPETQKIATLFDSMRADRVHMAIVVDEYGKLTGIITLEDLLEEIVGEIEDETDARNITKVKKLSEESWEVDGLISLSDAERLIGLIVPEELGANTLSGLVIAACGEMPSVKDTVTEYGYRFTILNMENHRLGKVLVEKLDEYSEELIEQSRVTTTLPHDVKSDPNSENKKQSVDNSEDNKQSDPS
jgi:CBS domain containing-hemolysin-like protein